MAWTHFPKFHDFSRPGIQISNSITFHDLSMTVWTLYTLSIHEDSNHKFADMFVLCDPLQLQEGNHFLTNWSPIISQGLDNGYFIQGFFDQLCFILSISLRSFVKPS